MIDPKQTTVEPPARRRRVPTSTWIGVSGTALLAFLGLASGGVWSMLAMITLVVMATALYGLVFRRTTWLRLPRQRRFAAAGLAVAFVALIGSTSAYAAGHPMDSPVVAAASMPSSTVTSSPSQRIHATATATATPTITATPTPSVVVKEVVETSSVPFTTSTVEDATVAQGTSTVTTAGVNGERSRTFKVTYTDGAETGRVLERDVVTTPPVTQVTTVGTYVAPPAPSCTNGTYVNSAGTTVCRPEVSPAAPVGATAQCVDGTWSFSQSRRGTCSHHGGVASWL